MNGVALELINLEKRGIITCMEELLNVKQQLRVKVIAF